MKIMVVGIGGVGGYLASILCAHYEQQVTLVARKQRGAALKAKGLVLHSAFFGEHVFHPQVVETPQVAGTQDIIFVCVKNYSLDSALQSIKPVVGAHTIVVPVLNGVDHEAAVRAIIPECRIVSSTIYITSAYNEDFSIKQMGMFARIFLGSQEAEALDTVYELLHHEGLSCHKSENIRIEEWKKYIMNCAYNVLTAYYEGTIGECFAKPQGLAEFKTLLAESYQVGRAAGVELPADLVETTYERVANQKDKNVSSSLARDVIAKRQNELETFSGYLVELAEKVNVSVPLSAKFYQELKQRCQGDK